MNNGKNNFKGVPLKVVRAGDCAFLHRAAGTKWSAWYCYCCCGIANSGSHQKFIIISKIKGVQRAGLNLNSDDNPKWVGNNVEPKKTWLGFRGSVLKGSQFHLPGHFWPTEYFSTISSFFSKDKLLIVLKLIASVTSIKVYVNKFIPYVVSERDILKFSHETETSGILNDDIISIHARVFTHPALHYTVRKYYRSRGEKKTLVLSKHAGKSEA